MVSSKCSKLRSSRVEVCEANSAHSLNSHNRLFSHFDFCFWTKKARGAACVRAIGLIVLSGLAAYMYRVSWYRLLEMILTIISVFTRPLWLLMTSSWTLKLPREGLCIARIIWKGYSSTPPPPAHGQCRGYYLVKLITEWIMELKPNVNNRGFNWLPVSFCYHFKMRNLICTTIKINEPLTLYI